MTLDLGRSVKQQLIKTLKGGHAHATFEDAVADLPAESRGTIPAGLPYSAWQILEHIRIAQHDILTYCTNHNGSYKPLRFPQDYWPKHPAPPDAVAWDASVNTVLNDRDSFVILLESETDAELVTPFAWGEGQTLLHESLLIIDHAGYHIGELVVLRRLLGVWKSS